MRGFVKNNTGRSRHIFKRTVYPGQTVPLKDVHKLLRSKVPEGVQFLDWLDEYLPKGWEISVLKETGTNKETLTAIPVVHEDDSDELKEFCSKETSEGAQPIGSEEDRPSLEYATPKTIDKLTARDLYNLRVKDNPKRIIGQVGSIHKLRRALTLCKNDGRKAVLTRILRAQIKKLNATAP